MTPHPFSWHELVGVWAHDYFSGGWERVWLDKVAKYQQEVNLISSLQLCSYQCNAPLVSPLLGRWWGLYGWFEEDAPIVGNLITSDCIVKRYASNLLPSYRGLNYSVCPTIWVIDVSFSQIPALPHYRLTLVGALVGLSL